MVLLRETTRALSLQHCELPLDILRDIQPNELECGPRSCFIRTITEPYRDTVLNLSIQICIPGTVFNGFLLHSPQHRSIGHCQRVATPLSSGKRRFLTYCPKQAIALTKRPLETGSLADLAHRQSRTRTRQWYHVRLLQCKPCVPIQLDHT